MILDDFVMLGKTVPETNSDGRRFVCTAGYSPELGQAIRIYPMARSDCPTRWSWSRIPLERNAKDSRRESWKIRGDRRPGAHEDINKIIERVRPKTLPGQQKEILAAITVSSIREANKRKMSLCVIKPTRMSELSFRPGATSPMAWRPGDLFGSHESPVAERFPWHPRIHFTDEEGDHKLMLRDWGCYELMRKHPEWGLKELPFHMYEALSLISAPPLFCGNLNKHRNAWLVISVFQGAVHARPEIFDQQPDLFASKAA